MILENQDVLEAPVFLEIEDAVTKCPQHIFDPFWRERRECGVVIRRLHDNFVGADSVHPVEHPFGLPVQISFDTECRKFVRHYTNRPAWRVSLSPSAVGIGAIRLNLGRRFALIAVAKGTEST